MTEFIETKFKSYRPYLTHLNYGNGKIIACLEEPDNIDTFSFIEAKKRLGIMIEEEKQIMIQKYNESKKQAVHLSLEDAFEEGEEFISLAESIKDFVEIFKSRQQNSNNQTV